MVSAESLIEKMSDEELDKAFSEIKEWRKSGVLLDGVVRETHSLLEMKNGTNIPITTMSEPFLWEISKRKYER